MVTIHPMGTPAFDRIVPSHMIPLLVPGVMAAIAIIKAAVAATIEVAVAVTIVYTIPEKLFLQQMSQKPLQMEISFTGLITLPIISATLLLVMISTSISQKMLISFMQSKQVQIIQRKIWLSFLKPSWLKVSRSQTLQMCFQISQEEATLND